MLMLRMLEIIWSTIKLKGDSGCHWLNNLHRKKLSLKKLRTRPHSIYSIDDAMGRGKLIKFSWVLFFLLLQIESCFDKGGGDFFPKRNAFSFLEKRFFYLDDLYNHSTCLIQTGVSLFKNLSFKCTPRPLPRCRKGLF